MTPGCASRVFTFQVQNRNGPCWWELSYKITTLGEECQVPIISFEKHSDLFSECNMEEFVSRNPRWVSLSSFLRCSRMSVLVCLRFTVSCQWNWGEIETERRKTLNLKSVKPLRAKNEIFPPFDFFTKKNTHTLSDFLSLEWNRGIF